MVKDILIEVDNGQTRVALLEDGDLTELYIERKGREKLVGNIYKGRVSNILPGMQAAFVDIGLDKNAFLYAGDIMVDKRDFTFEDDDQSVDERLKSLSIKKMLKVGQEIMVQVIKEPGGSKGPRVTTHVTLPGRLSVLLPTVEYIGVSRRIENESERARLRSMVDGIRPENMGVIVRTAARDAGLKNCEADILSLKELWDSIKARGQYIMPPALLHRDESLTYRAVRDMFTSDVSSILVDDSEQYSYVLHTVGLLSPQLKDRVQLYEGSQPLFYKYNVDSQADKALSRKVWLKSGGYLIFDYTEALTVIDVNTGKFVGNNNLQETVFNLNCEAASEIAKQLRLRDIGGIIVVDFIDMELLEHREQVLSILRQELRSDRTKTNVVGLTGLGLVEMTRKKVHQPVHTMVLHSCPYCNGSGMVLSDEAVSMGILRELKRKRSEGSNGPWVITAHPLVATQLLSHGTPKDIKAYAREDRHLHIEKYDITVAIESELPQGSKLMPRT